MLITIFSFRLRIFFEFIYIILYITKIKKAKDVDFEN